MATPTRFPKGLGTFAPRHVLKNFPIATAPKTVILADDFEGYIAANWPVATAVGGTATYTPSITGALKLATTASATDTVYVYRAGAQFQLMPQNQAWFNFRVAYPRTVQNSNDTSWRVGWLDPAFLSTGATDGIYFNKPSGGTTLNLIIRKGNVNTTFQNVGDLARPSGLFNDTNSVNGVLSAIIAGNAFTGVSVNTPGSGYATSPLVLTTSTAGGTGGGIPVNVALGATSYAGNPAVPIQSTDIPYGSLYAPYVANPGSGYTNNAGATTLLEVEPLIDLSFFYDGNDTMYFGVNGRQVLSIGPDGQTNVTAGGTVNVATAGPSFRPTNTLSTAIAPVQNALGSAMNIAPLLTMMPVCGFDNSTTNIRSMYLFNSYNGCERN